MTPVHSNRRRFLKNVALGSGSLVLGPVLDQIAVQAAGGSTTPPTRFVFVIEGNGLPPSEIQPPGIKRPNEGRATELSVTPLKTHDLSKALQPVAA